MKPLIVYYSLEGHTRFIADTLAKQLDADQFELKPQKEFPTGGFRKFFWGGKSVLLNEKPPLTNETIVLENYDPIFLGTPIWASSYAPPITTFLSTYEIRGKRLAFFACSSGGNAKRCWEKLQKALGGQNTILGTIDFVDPKPEESPEIESRVSGWLSEIL